jgi:hypothetical protein
MNEPTLHRHVAVGLAALLASLGAAAQGIDAETLRRYGGSYAADCGRPGAPRLRVAADALVVEQGNQRMTGRNAMSAYSFFGNSPPKDFQVALTSEVRGGPQMIFMVYADRAGPYIRLDGEPKVAAALGKALMAPKYRRCDGAALAQAPAPAAAAAPAPAQRAAPAGGAAVPHLGALAADPAFRRAYLRALGPKAAERWLSRLDGPAPETREMVVGGVPYVVVAICKAHDCYDHSAVFLYSAAQQQVIGLIQQNGAKTLVGAPGALAPQLERLWQAEFRKK